MAPISFFINSPAFEVTFEVQYKYLLAFSLIISLHSGKYYLAKGFRRLDMSFFSIIKIYILS